MVFSIALVAVLAAFASAQENSTMLGGWHPAQVTDDNKQLLTQALNGTSYSESVGNTRVCYSNVTSLQTQVVAGMNYWFTILGCIVDQSDGVCSQPTLESGRVENYEVKIFEQQWTNTLKVTSIKQVNRDTSK
ncbi:hypothetical protein PsorP6_011000 [Peronosclerospora sorghi]|uniref:Uncharacterized protein n=1 Tax=Peronosclerospora sorghi TaxID=230839 RepID=A0ACC0VVD2_9STRA|nr:hypothetical protein PsorP6_011000 [Peronosclerospora sorghi]